jgi:hypothetical protein
MKFDGEKYQEHQDRNVQERKDFVNNTQLENDEDIILALVHAGTLSITGEEEFLSDLINRIEAKYGEKKLQNVILDRCLKGIREAKNNSFQDLIVATVTMQIFSQIWENYKDKIGEVKDFITGWDDAATKVKINKNDVKRCINRYYEYGVKENFLKIVDNNENENTKLEENDNDQEEIFEDENNVEYIYIDEDENDDDEDFEDDDDEDDEDDEDEDEDDDDDDNFIMGIIRINTTDSMLPILWAMCSCKQMTPALDVPPNGKIEIADNVMKFKISHTNYKITLIENDKNLFSIQKLQIDGIPLKISTKPREWSVNLKIFPQKNIEEILKKPLMANLNCKVQLKFNLEK